MLIAVVTALAAYLLGTFPTAVLVAGRQGLDPTAEGSGNPGATNVYRLAGARAAAVVFVGDLAKGALAVFLGLAASQALDLTVEARSLGAVCGVAAVLGHCFPAQRRFRGGKGVATAGGVVLSLWIVVGVVAAAIWFVVARVAKRASVASLLLAIGIPVAVVAIGRPAPELLAVGALALIVLIRHTDNILRLLRGTERTVS